MKNIGVIGYGFVGSAVAEGFKKVANVLVYDKYKNLDEFEMVVNKSEIIFVCVPTPQKPNGDIDLSIMDEVMFKLSEKIEDTDNKIIVLKSTITPGTTDSYVKKYPNLKIIFNPEFLTEANSFGDFINPSRTVLGGDDKYCKIVSEIYHKLYENNPRPIYLTCAISAELVKYVCNSFLALKIGYFNEIYQLCEKLDINYEDVKSMVTSDPRIGGSHTNIPGSDGKFGWGGNCFTKDTNAFYNQSLKNGVDLSILGTAIKSNEKIRKS